MYVVVHLTILVVGRSTRVGSVYLVDIPAFNRVSNIPTSNRIGISVVVDEPFEGLEKRSV
jgi:hypothetical protein